jgi:hypothetical protein
MNRMDKNKTIAFKKISRTKYLWIIKKKKHRDIS